MRCCKITLRGAQFNSTGLMQGDKLSNGLLPLSVVCCHLSVPFFTPPVSNFDFYLFAWVLFVGLVWFGLFFCKEGKLCFVHILHEKPPAINCFVRKPRFKNSANNFFPMNHFGSNFYQTLSFPCPAELWLPQSVQTLPVTVGQPFLPSSPPKLHFPLQRNADGN